MSRHLLKLITDRNVPVVITAGYDRPLRSLYLSVKIDDEKSEPAQVEDDEINGDPNYPHFNSLLEGMRPDASGLVSLASKLGLVLPIEFVREIERDADNNVGNRIVTWEGSKILSDQISSPQQRQM